MFAMGVPKAAEPKSRNEYTVGWVCALPKEQTAATAMLDQRHPDLPNPPNDDNTYTLGSIGPHNIVIACLPQGKYGTNSAAAVAVRMASTFPSIKLGLMVGIGGGIPPEVQLGDVVVSSPGNGFPGVVQWDFGKAEDGGKLVQTGALNNPPMAVLTAVSKLRTKHEMNGTQIPEYLCDLVSNYPRLASKYTRPAGLGEPVTRNSRRTQSAWHGMFSALWEAFLGFIWYFLGVWALSSADGGTDDLTPLAPVETSQLQCDDVPIHYGLIASGNRVVKDTKLRDRIDDRFGGHVLCVEMEAAGLMDNFPCLVIRGVCDYADSEKNKGWQEYAAAVAAAYAKEVISIVPPQEVEQMNSIQETIQRLGHQLDQIAATNIATHNIVQDLEAGTRSYELEQWLSPPDPSTNYNHAKKQRHGRSGQWLLERAEYSAWKSGQNSFLWLHGIPGCGKTILASTVIGDLQEDDDIQNPLYFFFDFTDTRKQLFEHALRSLITQLYRKSKEVQRQLDMLFASCENGKQQPSDESLCKIFGSMAEQAGEVVIVIDALDECQMQNYHPTGGLLSWMKSLISSRQGGLRLFVTSRPEQHIKSGIARWANSEGIISIQSGLVEDDISAYIHTRVREGDAFARWQSRPDVQDEIEAALKEKANGMFRWVTCQLGSLENCFDPPTLRAALRSLPRTLDETYARILSNLPQENKHCTILILQFLAFSERPLTVEEAVDAIAVDTNSRPRFDRNNRMPIPEEISRYCSSLVAVTRDNGDSRKTVTYSRTDEVDGEDSEIDGSTHERDSRETVTRLQLAHFSVKEYLMSDRLEVGVAKHFRRANAGAAIAEICLAYLLDTDQSLPIWELKESYWLAEYSAQYWPDHAVAAESTCAKVRALLAEFFSCDKTRTIACKLYDPEYWHGFGEHKLAPALYYASLAGLNCSAQALLESGADVNAEGGKHCSALQAASYKGHEKLVQMLLDRGADVDAKGGLYGNALQAASSEGHEPVVHMLLNNGANANVQGGWYRYALHAASDKGHDKVVQMLLDRGADANAPGGPSDARGRQYHTALQAASYNGHEKVVQVVLNNGADVNAQGNVYGTANALQAASYKGHEKVVQMLLNKGADVNAQGGVYGNALQGASSEGHEKVVQMLLNNDADVNTQGGVYGNALQGASSEGHEKVVQMLLKNGADANARGGKYRYALHAASFKGHDNVAQTLLDRGADSNAKGGRYNTALQAASFEGHEKVVQMLLDRGADVNAKGGRYDNALQAASSQGHENVVQMLLNSGADIFTKGGVYGTALQAASSEGHDKVVQILLDRGADVNAQGGVYGNALQGASSEGHVKVVQMLLDYGGDIFAAGGLYGNALQAASSERHEKVVQLLRNTMNSGPKPRN